MELFFLEDKKPGPNSYSVGGNLKSNRGVTFKSRTSPFVLVFPTNRFDTLRCWDSIEKVSINVAICEFWSESVSIEKCRNVNLVDSHGVELRRELPLTRPLGARQTLPPLASLIHSLSWPQRIHQTPLEALAFMCIAIGMLILTSVSSLETRLSCVNIISSSAYTGDHEAIPLLNALRQYYTGELLKNV